MDNLVRDLGHAIRSFRRSPGLVLIASLSLALGIAVNVTMFTGVNSLLWRPLAYPDADQMVQVWQTNPERGWTRSSVSLPNFLDWRNETRTLRIAAFQGVSLNFAEGERPERLEGIRATGDLLDILGAPMALGRRFGRQDEVPGAGASVVLSHRLWTQRFDGDSAVVGRAILLDGLPHTVVGVLAPAFRFEGEGAVDLFVPLTADPAAPRGNSSLQVVGRLVSGATIERAHAEITGIVGRLAALHPTTNAGQSARVVRLADEVVDDTAERAGLITMVSVAFVLLIACANVANLLLARATGRDRELAVRSALGAGRGRLIREMLTESLLLAAIGGGIGLLLSFVGLGWLRSLLPADFPRIELLGFDWVAFAYAAGISVGSGLLFGIAPALRSSRPNLATSLRDGARGMTELRHGKMLSSLVGVEIALALVLLISAGLLIKGSRKVTAADPGFSTRSALAFRVSLAQQEYPDSASVVRFEDQIHQSLASLEGVTAVGAVSQLPYDGGSGAAYYVDREAEPEPGKAPVVQTRGVLPGYFGAIGIGLVRGRDVEPTDRLESPRVVVVNEALVRRHWADGNPLGRRIRFHQTWWEIVGVVRDTREFGPDEPAPAVVFLPAAQSSFRRMTFVLRTERDPIGYVERVRSAVEALAPTQPIYEVETIAQHVEQSLARSKIMPELLTVFGAMALLMAIIGVYGVMAYSVAQRTQEMGVRRALGAPDRSLVTMIIRQAAVVCGLGGVAGLAIASLVTRGLGFFLYGVSAFDPTVYGGVTLALLGAAIVASAIPARRAARVDPITALRAD
ncbi:MAG: ABC transporter permease [Gemmatimonadetes bacterium]|nr:ABC transporter permease [Gemmatimonadota bacterium]